MKAIATLLLSIVGTTLAQKTLYEQPQFNWKPEIGFMGSPSDTKLNYRPIIGVLTQAIDDGMR
jgi:hypothetical protein